MALPDQASARSSFRDAAAGVEFGETTPGPAAVAVADRIGPYRILEEVGEGGMGTVYLAEQDAPIRRRVALKVIKLGMDTREVVSRFEAERQALAIMAHPAIAQVFDAGSTPLGRPFFAMEYVPGESITSYCNRHHLTTRQRIELFLEVCDGVQHAHQKGIIHRDLKPSNILISERDGKPVPKIIDFGLANLSSECRSITYGDFRRTGAVSTLAAVAAR
jgi:non-specific serine/threonine protein kinase/serine/threonine-protein kinase